MCTLQFSLERGSIYGHIYYLKLIRYLQVDSAFAPSQPDEEMYYFLLHIYSSEWKSVTITRK